jgi:hypothetical protein
MVWCALRKKDRIILHLRNSCICECRLDVQLTLALHRLCAGGIEKQRSRQPHALPIGIPRLSAQRHKPDTTIGATSRWFHDTTRATNKAGTHMRPSSQLRCTRRPTRPLQLHAVRNFLDHQYACLRLAHMPNRPLSPAERLTKATFPSFGYWNVTVHAEAYRGCYLEYYKGTPE